MRLFRIRTFRRLAVAVAVPVSVGLLSVNALAFQQTIVQAPAGNAGAADLPMVPGIEVKPQSDQHGTGLELTVPSNIGQTSNPKNSAAGISIPGLGMLPKLDFGLELLYGAPDKGPNIDAGDSSPDALTVHGEVKKTF